MQTTDEAIKAIQTAGVQLNNLFQLANGRWRAQLREKGRDDPDAWFEFADGDTIQEAVQGALAKVAAGRKLPATADEIAAAPRDGGVFDVAPAGGGAFD